MAKILFFNIPAYGHVNATLPIVAELVRRGHEVVYCNAQTFEAAIAGSGARFQPYPDSATSEADFNRRIHNLVGVSVYLLEESLRLVPFALETIDREQPALVMFDSITLWGMLAARLRNMPSATSVSTFVQEGVPGLFTLRDFLHIFSQAFTKLPAIQRLRAQLVKTYGPQIFPGASILPCKGDHNLVYTSRAFQPDTPYIDDSFHFVGPSILATARKQEGFPWEALDPGRANIYISLGTIYNQKTDFYRAVFAAFSNHPARFILSAGRGTDLAALGSIPENFIVRPSVPQLELLQKTTLFITHGGMNSVNEALNYGVPLVVVPQQIEQALNGRQVARHGAGIVLADAPPYGKIDAGALRRAVDKVLADPAYRENAARLSRSYQEAGGYQKAADLIVSWLG